MRKRFGRISLALCAFFAVLGFSGMALAQGADVYQGDKTVSLDVAGKAIGDTEAEKAVREGIQRESGWYPKLRIGGTISLNHNQDVNGVTDGTALTFGLFFKGGLDYVYKNLEWQSRLDIEHQQTKLPTIDSFIKSVDVLDFNTLVLFRIPSVEWLGPFARFRLQSALFPNNYISDKNLNVRFYKAGTDIDKKQDSDKVKADIVLHAQEATRIAGAFEPLVLSESVGIFLSPYSSKLVNVSAKVGGAGQHLLMRGGYVAFDKDSSDNFYDVIQLKTTHSAGIEGEVELRGVFVEQVNWSLVANVFYPLIASDKKGLSGIGLLHTDITAKVSVRISTWASLDYALIVKKAPFISKDWQLTNTLLFSLGFDFFN